MLASGHIDIASAVTAGAGMQLLASRVTAITGSVGKLVEASMFIDDYNAFLEMGEERRPEMSPAPAQRPGGNALGASRG